MEIKLEKFKFNEVDEAHSLWSDEPATLYTNFPYLATIEECTQRLSKMMNYYSQNPDHFGPFAIRNSEGTFLGLTGGDAGKTIGEYEIWYFVHREMWGKKVATQAVAQLLNQMKHSGRVSSIKAEAVVNNEPSWRFLEKLGFQQKAMLPGAHKKNGMIWDRFVYTMSIQ